MYTAGTDVVISFLLNFYHIKTLNQATKIGFSSKQEDSQNDLPEHYHHKPGYENEQSHGLFPYLDHKLLLPSSLRATNAAAQ